MIVKIFNRGQGVGTGPVEYLLGKNRDREHATLLRGDADQTIELIDSLNFKRKYTSGVLSFKEKDITEEQKQELMDSFEKMLLSGLDSNQYQVLWVQHQDKDRLELNFVIPNVELTTGKRLQPYYDPVDRKRTTAWQEIINHDYKLADPNDPDLKRRFNFPHNLPADKKEAIETISNALKNLIDTGEITNRNDIVETLENHGFAVSRQTKNSISIKVPGEARATRLTGTYYEQYFRASESLRTKSERDIERSRKEREQRVQQARRIYEEAYERKCKYNIDRYRPQREDVSRAVEHEYQRLRKDVDALAAQNSSDLHSRSGDRLTNTVSSNLSVTAISNNQINSVVIKNERDTKAASNSAETYGRSIESTAVSTSNTIDKIREAIKNLTSTVNRYAESAIIACRLRANEIERSRQRDQSSSFKMR